MIVNSRKNNYFFKISWLKVYWFYLKKTPKPNKSLGYLSLKFFIANKIIVKNEPAIPKIPKSPSADAETGALLLESTLFEKISSDTRNIFFILIMGIGLSLLSFSDFKV